MKGVFIRKAKYGNQYEYIFNVWDDTTETIVMVNQSIFSEKELTDEERDKLIAKRVALIKQAMLEAQQQEENPPEGGEIVG